jgi:hypothetical protein
VTTRTHFAFRIDMWDPSGDNLVEHIAGVEDFQVAQATYRAAVERWPGAAITLRQGARVIGGSRRTRLPPGPTKAGRADDDSRPTPMAGRASRCHHRRSYWASVAIVVLNPRGQTTTVEERTGPLGWTPVPVSTCI